MGMGWEIGDIESMDGKIRRWDNDFPYWIDVSIDRPFGIIHVSSLPPSKTHAKSKKYGGIRDKPLDMVE